MGRGSNPDAEGYGSIADWARRRKRRREDTIKKESGNLIKERHLLLGLNQIVFDFVFFFSFQFSVTISDILAGAEERVLTNEQPDMDEGEAMIEEAFSGSVTYKATSFFFFFFNCV